MKISILTLFPEMIQGFINNSILKRAQEKKLVEINLVNIRDFATDLHGSVDDKPYGGGVGMVMRVDCVYDALVTTLGSPPEPRPRRKKPVTIIEEMKEERKTLDPVHIILTSPKGDIHSQEKAIMYAKLEHLVIVTGHYEGIDERIHHYVDDEISAGDFILTGGEIVATAITDSVVRLIPGVLKQTQAVEEETFFKINVEKLIGIIGQKYELVRLKHMGRETVTLLEYPHYTRPEKFNSMVVPEILLSGNHSDIYKWRMERSFQETVDRRPDLLR